MIKCLKIHWARFLVARLRSVMRDLNPEGLPSWLGYPNPFWGFRTTEEALDTLRLPIGTRSILYGYHCFWIHPWFVARGWWKLNGFPWDPRLWVMFFVHDLGYWGLDNLDDPDSGELHPIWGALLMSRLFDKEKTFHYFSYYTKESVLERGVPDRSVMHQGSVKLGEWGFESLFHSRFLAKRLGGQPSRLCLADKLAICLYPEWLYLRLIRATGEIDHYMKDGKGAAYYETYSEGREEQLKWFHAMRAYVATWVEANKDGGPDTMTPEPGVEGRTVRDKHGVWK